MITDHNPKFMMDIDEFYHNNSLNTLLQIDYNKIYFILTTAKASFDTSTEHISRFYPNPVEYYELLYEDKIDLNCIGQFFKGIDKIQHFVLQMRDESNKKDSSDSKLYTFYSRFCLSPVTPDMFKRLLYFIIFTNTVGFQEVKIIKSPEFYCFSVTNHHQKDDDFSSIEGESKFLFHGTKFFNIYSMMRNGIYSMSKTKFQSAGAAYGDGIYLSDRISTSMGYTDHRNPVILCYEVKNLKLKSPSIYVQEEKDVILRSIVWNPSGSDICTGENIILNMLNSRKVVKPHVTTAVVPEIHTVKISKSSGIILTVKNPAKEPTIPINTGAPKRVAKEINTIFDIVREGKEDSVIVRANFLNDNPRSPLLIECRIPKDTKLLTQGEKIGVTTIVFAVYVPDKYPIEKLGVRIVRPIFARHTGHIPEGGSLCLSTLYAGDWSPMLTIQSILTAILSLVSDDKLEKPAIIDSSRLDEEYTYAAYLNSYSFVAGAHSWHM